MEAWVRAKTTPQRMALRSQICLLAAEGKSNNAIAQRLGTSRPTVILWRKRFEEQWPEGLAKDAPLEISHSSVARIWNAHGLQPHRVKAFKLSKDKRFVEKLTDVVGLYLNPPDKALVLCVDEKSQIQALDRTQPGLPMKEGRCGTMTHDYKRNGTTTFFAALNALDGMVIGTCYSQHRNEEFLKFLRQIDRATPKELSLHLILDNYGTHNHPNVKVWLQKHYRFHLHFTPTSSSWLNLVERWFGEIRRKRIRRGTFKSVSELIDVIRDYIRCNDDNPSPFFWTKKADQILERVSHCKATMETLH